MIDSIQYCERTAALGILVEDERAVVREDQRRDVAEHDEADLEVPDRRLARGRRSRSPADAVPNRSQPCPSGSDARYDERLALEDQRAQVVGHRVDERDRHQRVDEGAAQALGRHPAADRLARPRCPAGRSRRSAAARRAGRSCRPRSLAVSRRRTARRRGRTAPRRGPSFHSGPCESPSKVTVPIITATSRDGAGHRLQARAGPPSERAPPDAPVADLEDRHPREQAEVDAERLAALEPRLGPVDAHIPAEREHACRARAQIATWSGCRPSAPTSSVQVKNNSPSAAGQRPEPLRIRPAARAGAAAAPSAPPRVEARGRRRRTAATRTRARPRRSRRRRSGAKLACGDCSPAKPAQIATAAGRRRSRRRATVERARRRPKRRPPGRPAPAAAAATARPARRSDATSTAAAHQANTTGGIGMSARWTSAVRDDADHSRRP